MEQKTAQLPTSDKLWVWFDNDNNRKRILWGAAILAVVGLVGGYYLYNQGEKDIEAGQALSKLMTTTVFSGGKDHPTPEAYLKVATEHPGTPAAAQAVLMAAGRYFSEGKFADAQAQFQRISREFPGNPFMGDAALGVAASLEGQGKIEEAANAYKGVSDRFPSSVSAPQAKFSMARILESQGNIESARAIYDEVRRNFPYLSVANEATVRLEELQKKMPAPKPPVITPITPPAPSVPQAPIAPPTFQPSLTNLDKPKS